MLLSNHTAPPSSTYEVGKPFILAQQSLCRRIPVARHDQFPGNDPSKSAEIAHGVIVSLDSVVVGFVFIRNDGTAIYEDGFIDGPSVPKGPRLKVFGALRVPLQIPEATGAMVILKSDPLSTIVSKGFGLTSCY